MKRILLFLLSVIMVAGAILNVSAEQKNILDIQTAQNLVYKAYDFFYVVHCIWGDAWWNNKDLFHDIIIDGKKYRYILSDTKGLPGGSFDAMKEYAKTIYTEEIAHFAYDLSFYHDIPLYTYINDELYVYIDDDHRDSIKFFKNNMMYEDGYSEALPILDIVYSDNKNATAYVYIGVRQGREEEPIPGYVKCEFVNTTDGWRISNSDFSDIILDGKKTLVYIPAEHYVSPPTSDPAFDRIALISTVPLACLVPALYLLRRRRRNVIG